MKHRTIILSLLSILFTALIFAANTFAAPVTDSTSFQVKIEDYLTLTLDQSDNIAQLNALTRFNTGSVVASVATNNALGYTLTFEDADDRNGLERSGYSSASVEDKPLYNIPSVVSATTYANLTDDTYGYFLGSTTATEATYLPVPLTSTEIASSDEPTAPAESTTVNFGVKIAATRPSGTYEDTVVFSAVANVDDITLEESYAAAGKSKVTISGNQYYTLQDMNPSICSAVTAIPDELQVADIRDNKLYWIAKLADNNCWMTQNLDLDLESTPTNVAPLTHANTDLGWTNNDTSAAWTPSSSTIRFDTSSDVFDWEEEHYSPQSADPGEQYVVVYSEGTTEGAMYESLAECIENAPTHTSGECAHMHVGNYYNWTAAIAVNDSDTAYLNTQYNTAPDSVCPAGWRLPQSVKNESQTELSASEWNKLYVSMGLVEDWDKSGSSSRLVIDEDIGVPTFVYFPLYTIPSGNVSGQSTSDVGYEPYYWTSGSIDSGSAYVNVTDIYSITSGYGDRVGGYSIRCIAR